MDFSTSKITPKKVCGINEDFSTSETTSKKIRGNDVDVSISEIASKKYMEMTRKFVEFGLPRIDVISTSNRRGFNVVCPLGSTN